MLDAWRRFWFRSSSPVTLGICRILFFGAFFLFYLPADFGAWAKVSPVFWMPTPLFGFMEAPQDPAVLRLLQVAWKAALFLACLGCLTRVSVWISFAGAFYLLGLPHCFGKTHHFDAVVVLIMGVLAFSRCGDALSLDRLLSPWRQDIDERVHSAAAAGEYTWPVQAARVLLSIVFFSAAWAKLTELGLHWVFSDNMKILLIQYQYHLANADPVLRWGGRIAEYFPWLAVGLGAASLAIETFYPLALFNRNARLILVPAAAAMLVGIHLLMGPTFYPLIICQLFWIPLSSS